MIYIITDEERRAFRKLMTDEERRQFIEQFWQVRNLSPTLDREQSPRGALPPSRVRQPEMFNDASGIAGLEDRSRDDLYQVRSPPDEREEHRSGGSYERPIEEGGGETTTFPFEKWRYRYLVGVGNDVAIEFVDSTMTGEYHMTSDPAEKDALLYVPGAGLTMYEQMGLADKADRFTRTDGTHLGTGSMPLPCFDGSIRIEGPGSHGCDQLQAQKPGVPSLWSPPRMPSLRPSFSVATGEPQWICCAASSRRISATNPTKTRWIATWWRCGTPSVLPIFA